jgi:hypothetical protein
MEDQQQCCEYCKKMTNVNDGQFAEMIFVSMFDKTDVPHHARYFVCAECIKEEEEERAFMREMEGGEDIDAAEEFRKMMADRGIVQH